MSCRSLMGDDAQSFAENDLEEASPRDHISDCIACVLNRRVESLVRRGLYADAINAAEPILARRLSCTEVPQWTYAHLLECFRRTGRRDEALRVLKALLTHINRSAKDLEPASHAIVFLALTGNITRAVGVAQRHLVWLGEHTRTYFGWLMLNAVSLLLRRLVAHGQQTITLRFTSEYPEFAGERWKVVELSEAVDLRADSLTRAFDARNGNDTFSRRRAALLATEPIDWPL